MVNSYPLLQIDQRPIYLLEPSAFSTFADNTRAS